MAERPRSEAPEEERTPVQRVGDAMLSLEGDEAADPVASLDWWKKSKEFVRKSAENRAVLFGGFIVSSIIRTGWGLLRLAKEAALKKGNVGFGKGYEIGKEALTYDKKDKK